MVSKERMRRAWRPLRRLGGVVSQVSVSRAQISHLKESIPLLRLDTSPITKGVSSLEKASLGTQSGFLAAIEQSDDDDGT